MNKRLVDAACLLAMGVTAAWSSPVHASLVGEGLVVDCTSRSLPKQSDIGDLLGQHNSGQVYASRTRLMGEIARACHKPGAQQVVLVPEAELSDRTDTARVARRRSAP